MRLRLCTESDHPFGATCGSHSLDSGIIFGTANQYTEYYSPTYICSLTTSNEELKPDSSHSLRALVPIIHSDFECHWWENTAILIMRKECMREYNWHCKHIFKNLKASNPAQNMRVENVVLHLSSTPDLLSHPQFSHLSHLAWYAHDKVRNRLRSWQFHEQLECTSYLRLKLVLQRASRSANNRKLYWLNDMARPMIGYMESVNEGDDGFLISVFTGEESRRQYLVRSLGELHAQGAEFLIEPSGNVAWGQDPQEKKDAA